VIEKSTTQARLCPSCANSIEESATTCRYCKADLGSQFVPRWLNRDAPRSEPRIGSDSKKKVSIHPQYIWMGAILGVALMAFFAGGYIQRSQLVGASQANFKQLQAKDKIIQSQEAQLAQIREQLKENSNQLAETKAKLQESQKELAATKQRLVLASRKVDRSNTSPSPAGTRTASRAPDTARPPPPPAAAKRSAEPGVYETTRVTSIHEGPSSSSRVLSQVGTGTRLNVVSSAGDWLEVRSKRGNPPGYVRSNDARLIGRMN